MKHRSLAFWAGTLCCLACEKPGASLDTQPVARDGQLSFMTPWPTWPAAQNVLTYPEPGDFAGQVLARTLAGLTAHVAQHSTTPSAAEYLWLGQTADPSLQRTLARTHGKAVAMSGDIWSVVSHFKNTGVVQGYILYHQDPNSNGGTDFSINIATSLCSVLGGVAVVDTLQAQANALNLPLLADARSIDYPTLITAYGSSLNRNVLAAMATNRTTMRDLAVASGALMTTDVPGGYYLEGLAFTNINGIVIGWTAGSEWSYSHHASAYGLSVIASDWTTNLAIEGSGATGIHYPLKPRTYASADEQDDGVSHYIAFTLSDGDNLCFSGNGLAGASFYDAPQRGAVPFGFGLSTMSILQARPDHFDDFETTAGPMDDFVSYMDYIYVESFGAARGGLPALKTFMASRLPATRLAGIHSMVMFSNDWLNPNSVAAYNEIAQDAPDMDGLFVMFAAGNGNIVWAPRPGGAPMPVLSQRYGLHSPPDDNSGGTPQNAVRVLSAWANQPVTTHADRFGWVAVDAWGSVPAPADAGNLADSNGNLGAYQQAVYTTRHLPANVKVVTPKAFLHMLNKTHGSSRLPDLSYSTLPLTIGNP